MPYSIFISHKKELWKKLILPFYFQLIQYFYFLLSFKNLLQFVTWHLVIHIIVKCYKVLKNICPLVYRILPVKCINLVDVFFLVFTLLMWFLVSTLECSFLLSAYLRLCLLISSLMYGTLRWSNVVGNISRHINDNSKDFVLKYL